MDEKEIVLYGVKAERDSFEVSVMDTDLWPTKEQAINDMNELAEEDEDEDEEPIVWQIMELTSKCKEVDSKKRKEE